jgi:predicted DNA-binding transcriptional regulator YafY
MRYEQAENLLSLALDMQAARGGVSLMDIETKFGVSRRTAQRMRDSVLRIFVGADEVATDERQKRWTIPKGTLDRLIGISGDELANLAVAIEVLERENLGDQAASLEGLAAKLKAVMDPNVLRRVDPDLEALLEAESLALRPGPRPKVRTLVLEDLRQAIKACRAVEIHHRNRTTNRLRKRTVYPYGFLYGQRHYLVAFDPGVSFRNYRLFSLPNIELANLQDEFFERDAKFSLEEFSRGSFGVFQEEPFDVVWRFSPRAASDARDFQFHPDQTIEDQPDGSLIVRFRAGGSLEMCWHLYCWGSDVEVLSPSHLAELCGENRKSWPGLP